VAELYDISFLFISYFLISSLTKKHSYIFSRREEEIMLYRTMPANGVQLSILGFGCMRLPRNQDGTINENKAASLVRLAIDRGINYIDTAWPYHDGEGEPFVGKALQDGYRDKVKLATKLPCWLVKERSDMYDLLDSQLERLQTDHIDYYLLHALSKQSWNNIRELGVIEFLQDAKEKGKVINVGFSFHDDLKTFKDIVDFFDWDFCQIQYNYLDTEFQAGTEGLKYAASRELGVIIMEPLRGGSIVRTVPEPVQSIWDEAEIKRTPAEWGLRWLWNQPEVTVVLSGMNEEEQLNENIASASNAEVDILTSHELELIRRAGAKYHELTKVGCTGCGYCMPCPAGVDIPTCFEFYNRYHLLGQEDPKRQYYFWLSGIMGKKAHASLCVKCGKCMEVCPQHLKIPDLLENVAEDLEGPEFEKN